MLNDIDKNEFYDHGFPNGLNPVVKFFQYRKLSKLISKLIKDWKFITPNRVTILGLIFFVLSVALISLNNLYLNLFGVFFGILSIYLDYLDGTLARIRSISSVLGKKLDALQDHLIFLLIPLSLIISLSGSENHEYYILMFLLIYFNIYFFVVGSKDINIDKAIGFLKGRQKDKLNNFQKLIINKTQLNIGFHTLFQEDSILAIYWITAIFGHHEISLFQLLLSTTIKNFYLFSFYYKKIKFK